MAELYTIPIMRVNPAMQGNRVLDLSYRRQGLKARKSCRPELAEGPKIFPRRPVSGPKAGLRGWILDSSPSLRMTVTIMRLPGTATPFYFFALCPCAIIAKPLDGAGLAGVPGDRGRGLRSGSFPAADRQAVAATPPGEHQEGGKAATADRRQSATMTYTKGPLVDSDNLRIFTGNSHPALAQSVCEYLDIPLSQAEVFKFANDNSFVRILENVRQRTFLSIQPTGAPVNDHLMELLIMIDACKRASAGRITAVIPYYGYGRTDKKDQPPGAYHGPPGGRPADHRRGRPPADR